MIKCTERLPEAPGEYCVSIDGIMFCDAVYMMFDGTEWAWDELGLESMSKTKDDVYWWPKATK